MSKKNLFMLIASALPLDFNPALLRNACDDGRWESDPRAAADVALRGCACLDWDAYREQNPDLGDAGIDPVEHFIRHGVFEGRQLCVKKTDSTPNEPPLISIVIANSNKSFFLCKTINSLLTQTLEDIEIIVVDDVATDATADILQKFGQGDPRLRILLHSQPQGKHMARKSGVAASHGEYLLFMDPGDFLVRNCCEKIYRASGGSFDIVSFNASIIASPHTDASLLRQYDKWFNQGKDGTWHGPDVLDAIYHSNLASRFLYNKMYKGDMGRSIFKKLPDGAFASGVNLFESFSLAAAATSMIKISDPLYMRRFDRDEEADSPTRPAHCADMFPFLNRLLSRPKYQKYKWAQTNIFMKKLAHKWLESRDDQQQAIFDNIAAKCGIARFLAFLSLQDTPVWEEAARKIRQYRRRPHPNLRPNHAGILYSSLLRGGAEKVILDQIPLLLSRGYRITLFLECGAEYDSSLPADVNIVYLGRLGAASPEREAHFNALKAALEAYPVDIMLCHNCYNGTVLWQLMLCKYQGIPTVLFAHSAFYSKLLVPDAKFNLQGMGALMGCGDKASVLSIYDELYYRNRGVDAVYIPNPARLPVPEWRPALDFALRKNNVLVFGRFGDDTKNVTDCLRVLRRLANVNPWIKMVFVGSFAEGKGEREFMDLASSLGVDKNMILTGWMDDATPFIDQSALLLSTAYQESFSLSIVEAQGRGLPVVMYNLPIMIAENNESVIRVEHGNFMGAAEEILKLLDDEQRWQRLSETAMLKARQFEPAVHIERLDQLIRTYDIESPVHWYRPENYRVVMRTLGFYGGQLPPWYKKS